MLILAPTERDGPMTARLLSDAGFACDCCLNHADFAAELKQGCGAVILAEEAITSEVVETMATFLDLQESWSDLPIIIITGHGEVTARSLQRLRVFGPSANVTLLERPLRPVTLLNAVEVALRARNRQYQLRDLLHELHLKEKRQRFLADTSRVFVSSLEYRQLLQQFANLAVPEFSDLCVVDVISASGDFERIAHAQAPRRSGQELVSLTPAPRLTNNAHPIIRAFQTGQPQFAPNIDERWIEQNGLDDDQAAIVRALDLGSIIVVPLGHGAHVLGTVSFSRSRHNPPFTPGELELAEELGKRAAVSVANAKLYEQVLNTNEELELRVAERTARLRETILELEAFSYTVSHDLRAPLRTLHGFSEILLLDYSNKLDAEGRDFLQRIKLGAERLDDLIENLLALAQLSREHVLRERIDLASFIPALIREYPSLHERSHFITIHEPLHSVFGHRSHLAQCLSNLLINALKFAPPHTPPRVEVRTERIDSRVKLSVKDNGIGIKQEHLQKIFEPFQRLHTTQEYEGSGMGLAIVFRAVQRMGGQVGVESTVGQGSKFWIELPAADEPISPPSTPDSPSKSTNKPASTSLQHHSSAFG